ncbi:MAG: hypothetical protein HQ567_33260 [Candidatus Nealsonbacteria bacterium]|nr:hypothetical protein [Candidatus Nealsonbacteria bacterium]
MVLPETQYLLRSRTNPDDPQLVLCIVQGASNTESLALIDWRDKRVFKFRGDEETLQEHVLHPVSSSDEFQKLSGKFRTFKEQFGEPSLVDLDVTFDGNEVNIFARYGDNWQCKGRYQVTASNDVIYLSSMPTLSDYVNRFITMYVVPKPTSSDSVDRFVECGFRGMSFVLGGVIAMLLMLLIWIRVVVRITRRRLANNH